MEYFLFSKSSKQGLSSFIEYLSIVTIKTFIQIYCKLLIFIFEQDMNKIAPIVYFIPNLDQRSSSKHGKSRLATQNTKLYRKSYWIYFRNIQLPVFKKLDDQTYEKVHTWYV